MYTYNIKILLETFYFYNYTSPEFNVYVCQLPFRIISVYYFWKAINEKKYLGTAGSLSLVNFKKTIFPIIVTNSDLISDIDYNNLVNYHNKKKADITICGKNKVFEMPYGEILQSREKVKSIIEKPKI